MNEVIRVSVTFSTILRIWILQEKKTDPNPGECLQTWIEKKNNHAPLHREKKKSFLKCGLIRSRVKQRIRIKKMDLDPQHLLSIDIIDNNWNLITLYIG